MVAKCENRMLQMPMQAVFKDPKLAADRRGRKFERHKMGLDRGGSLFMEPKGGIKVYWGQEKFAKCALGIPAEGKLRD